MVKRLEKVLQNLYDEQNGPPLIKYQESWERAMEEARLILEELEGASSE
jgi:hypothetical protein